MPLVKFRLLAAALALAVAPAPALAQDRDPKNPARTAPVYGDILHDNSPYAAKAFLRDKAWQDRARAEEPALFAKKFARALELSDLSELMIVGLSNPAAARQGLRVRPDCVFCQKPVELMAWVDRYFDYLKPAQRLRLRAVVWDWATLPQDGREWLAAGGVDEAAWAKRPVYEREASLRKWALVERDALLKVYPRTEAHFTSMGRRYNAIYEILPADETYAVYERVQKARVAVVETARARKALAGKTDPKSLKLLADLDAAPDLESKLRTLSGGFDGAGAAVRTSAPARAGQGFDDASRAEVSALLRAGLMREIEGTTAGEQLKAFYADPAHPFVVQIGRPPGGYALAWYQAGVMTFGEEMIETFIKSRGKTLADLRDPELLRALLRQIAPIFVHEAMHHRQDMWARDNGLPFITGQGVESEAMLSGALYVREKLALDPSYRDFMVAEVKNNSSMAREALAWAYRLGQDPKWFRKSIVTDHYAQSGTNESQVATMMRGPNIVAGMIEDELKRREALPENERRRLDAGPGIPKREIAPSEVPAVIGQTGGNALQQEKDVNVAVNLRSERIYRAYADRLESSDALVAERLKALGTAGLPKETR